MPHGRSPRHVRKRRKAAASPESLPATSGPVRIQKILAAAGLASRRGAEEFLRQGRVTVNGRTASLGDSADPAHDRVALDGEVVRRDPPSFWILNKPRGVLTTLSDPEGRPTIVGLVPPEAGRVFPVGRLDFDTSGLLLLTNDGALAQRLLHPSLGNEREYEVVVRGQLEDKATERLERGVHLDDGITAPAEVRHRRYNAEAGTTSLSLTLREGRKRQIRRSLLALGHPVRRLVRVRFGPLRLGRLARGEARPLGADEIAALRTHAEQLSAEPRSRQRRPGRADAR